MRILSQKRITQQNGFTLVEVIIAVAVFSVLAGIGTTMVLNALPNMRIKSAARDVYSVIMQAKNEAIRRGENVTLLFNCPDPVGDYVLFIDRRPAPFIADLDIDNDGNYDANITVITPSATVFPAGVAYGPNNLPPPNDCAEPDGICFASNNLAFTMRGIPTVAGTVALQATDSQGAVVRTRTITVSPAGRVNVLQN